MDFPLGFKRKKVKQLTKVLSFLHLKKNIFKCNDFYCYLIQYFTFYGIAVKSKNKYIYFLPFFVPSSPTGGQKSGPAAQLAPKVSRGHFTVLFVSLDPRASIRALFQKCCEC